MTTLSELLGEKSQINLAKGTVKVGDVYRITMTEKDGVTPKKGDTSRDKFFVVLGFDSNGVIYGGVIINSNINPNLPPVLKMLHMPIKADKYPFLTHNSFVNCVQLKTASPRKFSEWEYLGEIETEDVELIIGTIQESPNESEERLALFGLSKK